MCPYAPITPASGAASNPVLASLSSISAQSLANGWTKLTLATVDFDTSTGDALTATASQITIQETGYYNLSLQASVVGGGAAFGFMIAIIKGDDVDTDPFLASNKSATIASQGWYLCCGNIVYLEEGDIITAWAYQSSGGNLNTGVQAGLPVQLAIAGIA